MNATPPKPLSSAEVRSSFFDFFKSKEHTLVRSAPVVSTDDPTLMFTNAGMNQFKPIFLGENKEGLKRVYNSQKCIRVSGKHNDLEVVGKDTYHHTFFEMLGNWSFADYYKKEAISWAWELLTEVWKLPKARLFVTVHDSDDEAESLWKSETDVDPTHIMRFGDKENFWEMGEVGPCGPCSEIHYDNGDPDTQAETYKDPIGGVNGENARYIEIWNLVFIQSQRVQSGDLQPLDAKFIDTGMGFERICAILQNKNSNYDIDLFASLMQSIAEQSGVPYTSDEGGMPHRVIADHVRALSFAIADGAMPGNEGRGYVLRRILRRASRYARVLNQTEPFICKTVSALVKEMGEAFPELVERESFITGVIKSEEERFNKTLDQGLDKIKKLTARLKKEGGREIPGAEAFMLYDTYGFPLDLTQLIAEENEMRVDIPGYEKSMEEQHTRARSASKFDAGLTNDENWTILDEAATTEFTGYDGTTGQGNLLRYMVADEDVYIVLDKTPFYAEAGGQVGDHGFMISGETELEVLDTVKVLEMTVHRCRTLSGEVTSFTKKFDTSVDEKKRNAIRKNHSATHLLQAALQSILGDHIQQQGSRVDADNLRFDFTHHQAMSDEETAKVEELVNEQVQNASDVTSEVMSFDEAQKQGAMALFGEKYGDRVRVITMGAFSKEFCGGTHVPNTGSIGVFKITAESSIAAGVRRIEAVTGMQALNYVNKKISDLAQIGRDIKANPGHEVIEVERIMGKVHEHEKTLKSLKMERAASKAESLLQAAENKGGKQVIITSLGGVDKVEAGALTDALSDKLSDGVAILTNSWAENLSIITLVSKNLTGTLKAGDIVKKLSEVAGGKGGGRPDRAQAGSKNVNKENDVLNEAKQLMEAAW